MRLKCPWCGYVVREQLARAREEREELIAAGEWKGAA